ncbi:MAG: bifunctional isocitrate dehydrogenase kinase/phosphatase, partial [Rheinheimera sp.]|nr:bifunctional isocitrate dehydrogenase kinase/phosphatase [Rheinheimera sp.]
MSQTRQIAEMILRGFRKHFQLFQKVTAKAKQRFEQADWRAYQQDSSERISFYDQRVAETVAELKQAMPSDCLNESLWQQVKQQYLQYLLFHPQAELAETFYNSVFCRLFARKY